MPSLIIALGITGFWLFSPEVLVLAGNGGGAGGGAGIAALLIFSAVFYFGASCQDDDIIAEIDCETGSRPQKINFSNLVGSAGMIGTAVFASTGMLVTSGFTFNEVFYYRFPNFAFAFILLAFTLAMSLFPKAVRENIVAATAMFSVIGLAGLTGYGLFAEAPFELWTVNENTSVSGLLPLVLVFTGIDQVRQVLRSKPRQFTIVFVFSVLLLAGWMAASLRFVDAPRLGFSTIPYMTAAAKIGGEVGRMTMGLVIISGCFWAVHGLLGIGANFFMNLAKHGNGARGSKLIVTLLAAAAGIMMATGVAGASSLELYIRSSLLLWLGHTASTFISCAFVSRKRNPLKAYAGIVSGICVAGCVFILFFIQEKVFTAALFVVSMMAVTALLVVVLNAIGSDHGLKKK